MMSKKLDSITNASSLVFTALKDLKVSTEDGIKDYIEDNFFVSPKTLSMIPEALRKGTSFGVIQKSGDVFNLDTVMLLAVRKPPERYLYRRRRRVRRRPRKGRKPSPKDNLELFPIKEGPIRKKSLRKIDDLMISISKNKFRSPSIM